MTGHARSANSARRRASRSSSSNLVARSQGGGTSWTGVCGRNTPHADDATAALPVRSRLGGGEGLFVLHVPERPHEDDRRERVDRDERVDRRDTPRADQPAFHCSACLPCPTAAPRASEVFPGTSIPSAGCRRIGRMAARGSAERKGRIDGTPPMRWLTITSSGEVLAGVPSEPP